MRNKFGDEYFFCFVLPYVVKTITHRYEKTHARGDGKLLHLSGRFNQTGLYITRGGFLLVHGTRYSNLMLCKYQFNRSIGVCVCVCRVRACVRTLLIIQPSRVSVCERMRVKYNYTQNFKLQLNANRRSGLES